MNARRRPVILSVTLLLVLGQLFLGRSLKTASGSSSPRSQLIDSAQTVPSSFYTFNPSADSTVRQDLPNNNYGTIASIQTDNSPVKNFLLKFSVTGITDRPVVKAILRLYNVDPSPKGGDFHAMTDTTWSETTVNWNNAPGADSATLAALGAVAANTWYEVDLTALFQADGIYSLKVTSTSSDGADFSSREGVNPPQLILEVSNEVTSTPTITPLYSPTPTFTPSLTPSPTNTLPATQTFTPAPSATALPNGLLRFAVIGDYGSGSQTARDVATLIKSWNPDFILTVGDNNYPLGDATTIDNNVGKFYHDYIYPYTGGFGAGATVNKFFPALGNHDWDTGTVQAYLDYFTLPGNERYYDFVQGPIHFFVIDSDPREPDGNVVTSIQALWLQGQLAASTSIWNIVVMHHSPYSSGFEHGSQLAVQWPYGAWGADIVLSGHDHDYERLLENDLPYIVNGLGGASIYPFNTPVPGSLARYNTDYGAMLVEASADQMTLRFYSRASILVDTYTINAGATATPTASATPTETASPEPPTDTPTQTDTPVPSNTPTATFTATNTSTNTATWTPTNTPLPTSTFTATNTPLATFTPSNTPLPTDTPSLTPTFTPSNTPLPSATPTATFTPSNTPLPSNTPTATFTSTPTHTATVTPSATFTRTPTPSRTATNTAVPPTTTRSATPAAGDLIYLSSTSGGTAGTVTFASEDILQFDSVTKTWSLYFDGSDVGLSAATGTNVDAFRLMADGSILFSLLNASTVPNLGSVDDSDIIRFIPTSLGANTAGVFEWYFDGSDVGLSSSGENIDAIGFAPDGRLIISTTGSLSVTGSSGDDEDLVAFSPSSLGTNTSGTWSFYFDGSDVGLSTSSSEDVNGVSIDPATGKIYLTTVGNFSVAGVSGTGADIFACTPSSLGTNTACAFNSYWVGSQNGFGSEITDGVNITK